jgi:formin-binding protein 1
MPDAVQVRDLYRDRAALEKEYATKLQLLARKAADKKSKMEATIVVGEDPTKSWNPNTLKQRWA